MKVMERVLRKDPIIEALCEFHFEAGPQWNWTIPGRVYERIKEEFPQIEQSQFLQADLTSNENGAPPNFKAGIDRMLLWRADRSAVVQVGPDMLSVNQLRPYRGWPHFKPIIEANLMHYCSVAQPHMIKHILLRYVNKIAFPKGRHHFEDFLNVYPQIPDSSEQSWLSWAQRVEIVREDLGAILAVQAGTQTEPGQKEPSTSVVLDIGFAYAKPQPLDLADVSQWLETAHQEIETLFFKSVTPRALELFEEVPNES